LLNLAEDGDLNAAQALEKQAVYIGRGLQPIIAGLSPRLILIAGDITGAWNRFGPIIEKQASVFTLAGVPPQIQPTHEGDFARLRGAAALVFQRGSVREQLRDQRPSERKANGELETAPQAGFARPFSQTPGAAPTTQPGEH
jgi:ROK family